MDSCTADTCPPASGRQVCVKGWGTKLACSNPVDRLATTAGSGLPRSDLAKPGLATRLLVAQVMTSARAVCDSTMRRVGEFEDPLPLPPPWARDADGGPWSRVRQAARRDSTLRASDCPRYVNYAGVLVEQAIETAGGEDLFRGCWGAHQAPR